MLHFTSTHLPPDAALRIAEVSSALVAPMVTAQTTFTTATYEGLHGMGTGSAA